MILQLNTIQCWKAGIRFGRIALVISCGHPDGVGGFVCEADWSCKYYFYVGKERFITVHGGGFKGIPTDRSLLYCAAHKLHSYYIFFRRLLARVCCFRLYCPTAFELHIMHIWGDRRSNLSYHRCLADGEDLPYPSLPLSTLFVRPPPISC